MTDKSILNHDERKSSAWNTLKAHIQDTLTKLDTELRKDLSYNETTQVRGGIKELDKLIKAVETTEIEFNEEKEDHYQ